jgi:hypothetical protein
MFRTECFFLNGKCPEIERFGQGVPGQKPVKLRQVVRAVARVTSFVPAFFSPIASAFQRQDSALAYWPSSR